jgi:hypothetical protein
VIILKKIIILLLLIIIFASGCAEKERKYVSVKNSDQYLIFSNDEGKTVFFHTGGETNYKGTWTEDSKEINVWLPDNSNVVFLKYDNGSIGMKVDDYGRIVEYKKA